MRMPNHLAGGFCLTGFFSSVFFGINVLSSPVAIAAVVFGSIMPDCDNPRSLAGKIVYPVAKWLNRKVGHRTLTHSLVFIGALALFGAVIEKTFFGEIRIAIILTISWFIHVLLDTFTLQGVQMMFPFSFEPYVMFDKPEARMRNGDFRAESAFFLAFAVLTFAQGDLWKNGFWTSYNNQFGTIENLDSERRRSADALLVTATAKRGTEEVKETGLLVELKSSGMVLLGESGFVEIGDDEVFQYASFEHSGEQISIRQQNLIGVSVDSLNSVLQGKKFESIEVSANQTFRWTKQNGISSEGSNFKAGYVSSPPLFSEIVLTPELDTFIADRAFEAEIALIQGEIQRTRQSNLDADAAQRRHDAQLAELRKQYSDAREISERQKIHDELAKLETKKIPRRDDLKVEELKSKIRKIRRENSLRSEAKKREIELRNSQELARLQETRFTGIVRFVEVQVTGKIYRVVGVMDGDTVELLDDSTKQTFRIRLAHIDCPEKSQPFGRKAKQFTSDFCFGEEVVILEHDRDRYGRVVCELFARRKCLNEELVKAGLAWHYKKYSDEARYAAMELEAMENGIGLWREPNPMPPWMWRKKDHKSN